MENFANTAKQFSANIDKAQEEIYSILFPMFPATPENLAQIQPRRTATKRYKPNEEIPPILEFNITPNRPLVLNTLRLWRLAQYHLYFINTPNITINTTHLDFGNDIQDNRYERKTLGKFTFRGCAFTEITMGLCDFEELHFYDCVFNGKVILKDCHFQKLEFQNCMFESSIAFDRIIFENKAFFIHSTFKDSASFRHSQYMQGANFSQSIFMQKIDCTEVRFQDFANFTHTTFKDYADFSQCEFEKTANFYGAKFEKAPNFSQVQFKGSLNAVNMDLDFGFESLREKIKAEYELSKQQAAPRAGKVLELQFHKSLASIANDFRDSFRIFKNALIKENNNLDASEFHKLELYCKEIELGESPNKRGIQAQSEEDVRKNTKLFKESIDWFLLRFYRKLSEHHTDLLRVLNNLVLLIALYAGFVYIGNFKIDDAKTSSISQQLFQHIEAFQNYIKNLSVVQEYSLVLIILLILFVAFAIYLVFKLKLLIHIKTTFKIILTGIMKNFWLLLKILSVILSIFCIITFIVLQFETNNRSSILVNIFGFCLFIILYLWLVCLDSIFLRYIVVIIAYIVASVALGDNIAILNPLLGKLISNKEPINDPLFTAITLAYTILTLLVLFSLQKTARKNSIVPS
nr:pentapeptide repeat-containing protein [Helicobacter pullorum]